MRCDLRPRRPERPGDPTLINTAPRPDFYFLTLFAGFALMPPYIEDFFIIYVLPLLVLLFFAVPFISNRGEKHPAKRPGAIILSVMVMTTLFVLALEGSRSPWSPVMDAWSGVPVPPSVLEGRSPLERQGAVVLQAKQCRNCHAIGGEGGERGPDLSDVATRLTSDQLVRQVLQGGGNMPAYGKNLSPPEVTALVAFMSTLRPENRPAAHDSASR